MKRTNAIVVLGVLLCSVLPLHAEEAKGVGADEALARLVEGNKRFVEMKLTHPEQDIACRTTLAKGQQPFAVILGCSDSRVPPEVIFDQGLGDLFVVRVAGNVADDIGIASIEYAVEHLGSRLIVVLGHERCGA
jgi:carbonic anhydrase